jgi:hypothetical protein
MKSSQSVPVPVLVPVPVIIPLPVPVAKRGIKKPACDGHNKCESGRFTSRPVSPKRSDLDTARHRIRILTWINLLLTFCCKITGTSMPLKFIHEIPVFFCIIYYIYRYRYWFWLPVFLESMIRTRTSRSGGAGIKGRIFVQFTGTGVMSHVWLVFHYCTYCTFCTASSSLVGKL